MLILLLAYSILQTGQSEAGPIPASIELRDVASYDGQNSQRSLANVVWSCLSTILLCTWVAVHPNVHFRAEKHNQGWFKKWLWDPLHEAFTYKLPLFLWALLVPEYILAWAVRQYLQAGVISKQVPGWTRTHGHFMIMGGFHLFRLPADAPSVPIPLKSSKLSAFSVSTGHHSRRDEVPVCPLQFTDVPVDILEILAPTETELKDRGKSDALTKIIVLFQTLWFVIQCIARGTQHLPLTELEVVTLAYAALNLFIYVFWWDKPQNVECPIRVYKTSTASHKESGEKAKEWGEGWASRWSWMLIEYTTGAQDSYVTISEQRSIPMFWSGRSGNDLQGIAGVGTSLLGSAFGAIHCIAWSSEYPSRSELLLWRVSCIAMIVVPFMVLIVCAATITGENEEKGWSGWIKFTMGIMAIICIFLLILSAWLYIASRIATLVIAFTTLRSLPPAAFTTVNWTTFIPHI
ncbi:hypothetical protein M408DRAFT_75968 [Serendipita vermifera MAFF 305830]|uniref:Uncharacterized protein n=1 Tax=Serendipita vermifera MAFF 305830 TaxID=933852 RepID=A0A0C2WD50_SERVB|nr:hypothetical protein M408DRAFT_75968 [Serendipita vermifera MAFF 305830]